MRKRLAIQILAFAMLACSGMASAQTIDPAFKADIERLLDATGASALGAQMASLTSSAMLDGMRKAQPNLPERLFTIVQEVLSEEFTKGFSASDGMLPKYVAIYAKYFTHDEVRGLLAFYQTDLGKKTIKTLPTLAQEGAAIGQQWGEVNMPRILEVLQARLKAEKLIP
jgi:uncharacterized protein